MLTLYCADNPKHSGMILIMKVAIRTFLSNPCQKAIQCKVTQIPVFLYESQ